MMKKIATNISSPVAQSMGSAVFIPVAQVIFQNILIDAVHDVVPNWSPREVLSAGASSGAISMFPKQLIPILLKAYAKALSRTFVVGVPLAAISLVVAFFMPWFRYHNESQTAKLKKDNEPAENEKADKRESSEEKISSMLYKDSERTEKK